MVGLLRFGGRMIGRHGLKKGGLMTGRFALRKAKYGLKFAGRGLGKTALYGGSMWLANKFLEGTGWDAQSLFGFGSGGGLGGPSLKNKLAIGTGINGQSFTGVSEQDDDQSNDLQSQQKTPNITEPDDEGAGGSNSDVIRLLYKILRNTEKDLALTESTLSVTTEDLNKTIIANKLLQSSAEKTEDSLEELKATEKEILDAQEPQKKLAKLQLDELTKQNSDSFMAREDDEGDEEGGEGGGEGGGGGSWLSTLGEFALEEGLYQAGKFAVRKAVVPAVKAVAAAGGGAAAGVVAASLGMAAVLEGAAGSVKAARLKEALPKDGNTWDDNSWNKLLSMMDDNEAKIYKRAVEPYLKQLEAIKDPEADSLILEIRRRWYNCLYNLRLTGSTNGVLLDGSDNPYVTAQLNSAKISNIPYDIQQCRATIQANKKEQERHERVENAIQQYKDSGAVMARDSKEYQDAMELRAWQRAAEKIKGYSIPDENTRRKFFENYIKSAGFTFKEDLYRRFTKPLQDGEHRLTEEEEIAIAEAEHSKNMRTNADYRAAEETRRERSGVYDELENLIDSRLSEFEYDDQLSREENAANFVQLADELEEKISNSNLDDDQKQQLSGKIVAYGNTFAREKARISETDWESLEDKDESWNEFDEEEDFYHTMRWMASDEIERREDQQAEMDRRQTVREQHEQNGEHFSVIKPEFKNSEDPDDYDNPDNYMWFKSEEDQLRYRLETYPEDREDILNSPLYSNDLLIKYGLKTQEDVQAETEEASRLEDLANSEQVDDYGLTWLSGQYKGNRFRDNMGRYIMAKYADGGELSSDDIATLVSEALEFAKDQEKRDNGQTVWGANGRYDEYAVFDPDDESFSDEDRETMERILTLIERQGREHNEEREAARRKIDAQWEMPLDGQNIDY